MRVECFFDTNVLVYAASSSRADAAKRTQALDVPGRKSADVTGFKAWALP